MTVENKEFKIEDSVRELRSVFATGHNTDGAELEIRDALALPNFPIAFKRVVTEMLLDTIEPQLIGTSLLQTVRWTNGTTATFHTLGALGTESLDMAEGMEYPEFSLTYGGGMLTANIGKSGIAMKITEEMLKYSQWDVISINLRKAANALARHKERKIFNMISNSGVVTHDNVNPNKAEFGRTTGRSVDGSGNGSFTADDMFEMYASLLGKGFQPNVILCHPLAWATFAKDPIMREHVLHGGDMSQWFNTMPNGDIAPKLPDAWKSANRLAGESVFNPSTNERVGTQTSTFNLPSYFPGTGLKIIASPHVPFDAEAKTTSIIMVDTREIGAIVVGEELTMDEWNDPSVDIKKIKLRERYGFALYNDGLAIAVARNVSIEPNEMVLPPHAVITNIPAITRK